MDPQPSGYDLKVAAVVPAYRVRQHLAGVISSLPTRIGIIVVVDDCCPERSGEVAEQIGDARVTVVYHSKNKGVGGAVKTGCEKACELGAEVIVKVDGDGQMDPRHIDRLVAPLIAGEAAYTKGNRFWYIRELERMPWLRRLGNLVLSFWVKAASGQWSIFDPTNGYVAIRADVFKSLDLTRVSDDYFFEISLLIELGKRAFRVFDVPMPSIYNDEKSSLSIKRVIVSFPPRLLRRGLSRFVYRHFWFGFSITGLFLLAGVPLMAWGVLFGGYHWWYSWRHTVFASAGTVMLAAMPFLTGFHLTLLALQQEVSSGFNSRVSPDGPIHS